MSRPLTVLAAANSFDEARFADHHLARALAAHGPVLYVDPPQSPMVPLRRPEFRGAYLGPRIRDAAPGVYRYTCRALPRPERPIVTPVTATALRWGISRAVRTLGFPVGVHIGTSVLVNTFEPDHAVPSIFWFQDDFVGGAELMGTSARRNARGEHKMLRTADAVVAANPLLVERAAAEGVAAACIPFGCDIDNFPASIRRPAPADVGIAGPYALVMGQFGHRVERPLLDAIAARGVPLVLIGPFHDAAAQADFAPLLARPDVTYLGARPFGDLGPYLAAAGVGLVPYRNDAFNRASFPLKTLEYLASGLPVVATDLPALRWLDAPDVAIADDPEQYAAHVVTALHTERSSTDVARRRRFAEGHTWARRAEQWVGIADALMEAGSLCVR